MENAAAPVDVAAPVDGEPTPAEPLFASVSREEYRRRYKLLWREMDEAGFDALLVYGDSASNGGNLANVFYLTGYKDPLFSYVLLRPGQEPALLISNPLYLPHARLMAAVESVEALGWDPGKHLVDALTVAGVASGRIGLAGVRGIQQSSLPHEHMRRMTAELPRATWLDGTALVQSARRLKSAEEVRLLRRGAELTDATVEALYRDGCAGMSECQLAGLVYGAAFGGGGEQRLTFIGSTRMDRPDLVFPRQSPAQRRIGAGDVVLTELSTGYGGYAGQIHRALVVGEPSPQYRELFDVAREVYDRSLEALGPGRTDEDLRRAAAPVIERSGVWTMDALVHGWGLTIEPPRLDVTARATIQRPQEPTVFAPGMVLVLQPHVLSQDRRRGLQLGSLVVITENGAEALQKYPMEWVCLDG